MKSFIPVDADSHFSLQNLPYGVFKPSPREEARAGVAIGDYVLDLSAICRAGLFNGPLLKGSHCFLEGTLNAFMAMGRPAWKEARATIQKLLSAEDPTLRDNGELRRKALLPMNQVQMVLPAVIGDYTDFFFLQVSHTELSSNIIWPGSSYSSKLAVSSCCLPWESILCCHIWNRYCETQRTIASCWQAFTRIWTICKA